MKTVVHPLVNVYCKSNTFTFFLIKYLIIKTINDIYRIKIDQTAAYRA